MSIFAISDIYGNYDQLINMLDKVNFDIESDSLILIGNIIDNTRKSFKMLEWLISNSNGHILTILGINEEKLLQDIKNKANNSLCDEIINNGISLETIYDFIYRRPTSFKKKVSSNLFTFSSTGYTIDIYNTPYHSIREYNLSSKYDDIFLYGGLRGHYHIFGYYSTTTYYTSNAKSGMINVYNIGSKRYININCGIYTNHVNKKLGCLCLDNFKEYYI